MRASSFTTHGSVATLARPWIERRRLRSRLVVDAGAQFHLPELQSPMCGEIALGSQHR